MLQARAAKRVDTQLSGVPLEKLDEDIYHVPSMSGRGNLGGLTRKWKVIANPTSSPHPTTAPTPTPDTNPTPNPNPRCTSSWEARTIVECVNVEWPPVQSATSASTS